MPTSRSIPDPPAAGGAGGGLIYFPEALQLYPDADLGIYNRVSAWNGAGPGKVKLEEKTHAIYQEIRKLTDRRLRFIVQDVEKGQVSARRKALRRAVECGASLDRQLILVTSDLSRFLRSEVYDRRTNREAWPTPDEFIELYKLASGVILATLAPLRMTEKERHKRTMERAKQAGKCGRPSDIVWPRTLDVLEMLEWGEGESLQSVADTFGVKKAAVWRFWDKWKHFQSPTRAYLAARAEGRLSPDGRRLVSKP